MLFYYPPYIINDIRYIYLLLIMITPIVKPVNVKEHEFKQSKYDVAPRLPFSQIITGPSGSGKEFYFSQ